MHLRTVLCFLLLALCGTVSSSSSTSSKQFRFNGSPEMWVYVTVEGDVSHMEFDQYTPGILFSDEHTLKTSDGVTTQTIVGQPLSAGGSYMEGVGTSAFFDFIAGFYQIAASKVLVVDRFNQCIREVNRLSRRTATYAGTCGNDGYMDGSADDALFSYPWKITADNQNSAKLLVLEGGNRAVRHMDINTKKVTTFFRSTGTSFAPQGIAQDNKNGNMYLSSEDNSIYLLGYHDRVLRKLAGSSTAGSMDGRFLSATFNNPRELLIIDGGRKIVVADDDNHVLRVLNLRRKRTSTVECSSCSLSDPLSLLTDGSVLYIGGYQNITTIKGASIAPRVWRN